MSKREQTGELKSLSIVFSAAQEKLRFQSDQWNAVDQKNAVILAVYGITLAVFFASGVADVFSIYKVPILILWWAGIVIGIICNYWSLRPRDFDMPPALDALIDNYLKAEPDQIALQLLSKMKESKDKNDVIIREKTKFMSFSIQWCLPVALGFSVIAVFIKLLRG